MTRKKISDTTIMLLGVLALVAVLFLAGCKQVPPEPRPGPVSGTGTYETTEVFNPSQNLSSQSFQSIKEYNDFVKEQASQQNVYYGGVARGGVMMETVEMAVDSVAAPTFAKEGDEQATDFSETNIQVEGVDEADIIKTDGEYIYTVTGNTLFIIKAYPGEDAEIVSTLDFDQRPTSLFINGNKLAVFGNFHDLDFFKKIEFTPRQGMTYFNIYDISDKSDPELVKEYKFEGNYFEGRMIDDYVYIVTTTRPEYREIYPTPVIVEDAVVRTVPVKDIFYYPIPYQSAQFANIHAINIARPSADISSKTIVVEGSQNMYMSQNNIFITYTEYVNEWEITQKITIDLMMDELTASDKILVEKIKNTDNDVLSHREKQAKIMQIIESYVNYLDSDERDALQDRIEEKVQIELEKYKYREYTLIHKISVDKNVIRIDADGKVPGHILNQFSMDEHNDVFRIATTVSPAWSRFEKERTESTNNIYTLDKDLDVLDELEGMAEGEQIYSTRFMGDRLYMVTFRQVDPFFVIDLSNPNNIKEIGKLKIPGFSRYLHPYDKDTIIGLGRDATESGRTQGLKISLFDVSDVENPKEIAKFVTDQKYAQSTAEYEHKAFLFSKEKELLVIPVYSYDYRWDGENTQGYNGAMVFKITKDDIELRGIVDHSMARGTSRYYGPLVERSLYIEDLLYTKSPTLLRINNIDDLDSVNSIDLEPGKDGPYKVY